MSAPAAPQPKLPAPKPADEERRVRAVLRRLVRAGLVPRRILKELP